MFNKSINLMQKTFVIYNTSIFVDTLTLLKQLSSDKLQQIITFFILP